MSYFKIDEEEFKSIKDDYDAAVTSAAGNLGKISSAASRSTRIREGSIPINDDDSEARGYRWAMNQYNGTLDDISTEATNGAGSLPTVAGGLSNSMGQILDAVDEFESGGTDSDAEAGDQTPSDKAFVDMNDLNVEKGQRSDGGDGGGRKPQPTNDHGGGGDGGGTQDPTKKPTKKPTKTPSPTPSPSPTRTPGPTPTGTAPVNPSPDPTPTKPSGPILPGFDPSKPGGGPGVKPEGSTPGIGDLIGKTISKAGEIAEGEGNTGADIAEIVKYGAAGVGALMMGLSNPGGDDNYLAGLSAAYDNRALENSGLDVFDHPDHMSEMGTDYDMISSNKMGASGGLSDPEAVDGNFSLRAVDDLDEDERRQNRQGGALGKGAATLAGAAAVGGLAAGIAVGVDAEQRNGIHGQDYIGEYKHLDTFFFGALPEEDDQEQIKKQLLRERISLILLASTLTGSLGTFILANMDVINPLWFVIAAIMFGASFTYYNYTVDKKNKRRQELRAMGKRVNKRSFFGTNNNTKKIEYTKDMEKEADWVLLGMVLLSSSAFILKAYDVISWLLFLILLILFVVIIGVYIFLKKKLGEK